MKHEYSRESFRRIQFAKALIILDQSYVLYQFLCDRTCVIECNAYDSTPIVKYDRTRARDMQPIWSSIIGPVRVARTIINIQMTLTRPNFDDHRLVQWIYIFLTTILHFVMLASLAFVCSQHRRRSQSSHDPHSGVSGSSRYFSPISG